MRVIFPVIEENQLSHSYTESTHIPKQKSVTEQVNRSFQKINQKSWQQHCSPKQLYSSAPIQQFTYIQYPSLQSAIAVTKVDVVKISEGTRSQIHKNHLFSS